MREAGRRRRRGARLGRAPRAPRRTAGLIGAGAPPELKAIREKVNACYGYNAIARIKLTQTATAGFGEVPAPFDHAAHAAPADPAPAARDAARTATQDIADPALREALAALGARVMSGQTQ